MVPRIPAVSSRNLRAKVPVIVMGLQVCPTWLPSSQVADCIQYPG
jgi:hypothetical protein